MARRAGAILAVRDVEDSIAFYRDAIGFTVEAEYDDPPYATLELAGSRLSLAEQGMSCMFISSELDEVLRTVSRDATDLAVQAAVPPPAVAAAPPEPERAARVGRAAAESARARFPLAREVASLERLYLGAERR